jgi:predicted PurR-regulated permease PerM
MKTFELQPLTKSIVQLLLIAVGLYALFLIKSLIIYAIIGLYISVLGRPVAKVLRNLPKIGSKLSTSVVSALTLVLITGVFIGLGSWFVPVLIEEFSFLNNIAYGDLFQTLESEWQQLDLVLNSFGIDSTAEFAELNRSLQNFASVDAISAALGSVIGSVGTMFIGTFSVLFISFFLLKEQDLAHRFIDAVTPKKFHSKVDVMTPEIKRIVTRYSFGILFQISTVFALLALGMSFIGIEGAVVLALCAAVFNLIPYVGPLIGGALGILLGMGQLYTAGLSDPSLGIDLVQSLYLLFGLFAGVQLLDNLVFQPIIFSNSVGAHPLEIFLVISIAGTLLGIRGMIIAVPVYSIGRIVLNTALNSLND